MTNDKVVNKSLEKAVKRLTDCVAPNKLARTLTVLHLEYISLLKGPLPNDLADLPHDLLCVLKFLEEIDQVESEHVSGSTTFH